MVRYISDFSVKEIPGGSEYVDKTIVDYLGLEFTYTRNFIPIKGEFYIISNISLMPQTTIDFLKDNCSYVIIEHDYKIHHSRHPWRYLDSKIPKDERINYEFYNNAKAVFVQTDDHLSVFDINDVSGNFISLDCGIWSKEELDLLEGIVGGSKNYKYAVVDSDNWIKNTKQALELCETNKLDYEVIKSMDYEAFLEKLSQYSTLVFLPLARETLCRLIVEARCLEMNVITNNNSGAWKADWYYKTGKDLISYLRERSSINLKNIRRVIDENKL